MTQYTLPDLPYDYSALEPHLSAKVLELHHDKHHRTYVEHANQAAEQMQDMRKRGDFKLLAAVERELAFNVSGHVLHSLYWQNLAPDGGERPKGLLLQAIERDFGGFDVFRKQLTSAAATIMGSGWAALVWEPLARRLGTTQIHDHQSQNTQAGIPLMVIDAWEHAYYAQYQNEKGKYFDAIWNLWNWDDIAARYASVQSLDLRLGGATRGNRRAPAEAHATH